MAFDIWTGFGDWNTNPGNWSAGVPTSSTDALISSGSVNTLSTTGAAKTVTVNVNGTLSVSGTSFTVAAQAVNYGQLTLSGNGLNATIGGSLSTFGTTNIGNSGLTSSMTVTAAGLNVASGSDLRIAGDGSAAATALTTLAVTTAIPTILAGRLDVFGNADLQLTTSGITTVAGTGTLDLAGSKARVSIGANTTNTGLAGLTLNSGVVNFEGNVGQYLGGVSLTTTTSFTNYGSLYIDDTQYGEGGSNITFGGALSNTGSVVLGNTGLSAATSLTTNGLTNNGILSLQGNAQLGGAQVTYNAGAVGATIAGSFRISGNADLQTTSQITSSAAGSTLELDGSQARISIGSAATNTALTQFATNNGNFYIRGNTNLGVGGVTLTTSTAFTNNATTYVDTNSFGDGGSTWTISGALTNLGTYYVGNTGLSAATSVSATGLTNLGTLVVQGQVSGSPNSQATLNITGATSSTATGITRVGGNGDLALVTGIATIARGAIVELDGSQARISLGLGTTNTALGALADISGEFRMRGNSNLGLGGVSITTTTALSNTGTTYVDAYSYGDGGSSLTLGGSLTNPGTFYIGNVGLSANTSVSATALSNTGHLEVQGDISLSPTYLATLAITGANSANSTGFFRVGGDADVQLVTGITSVLGGAVFELDGVNARVSIGAGTTNTALTGLSLNAGDMRLRGNSNLGAGGVNLTTSGAFTNSNLLYVDGYSYGDYGSTFTIGGVFTNSGQTVIGNAGLAGNTTVSATGFNNNNLVLQGNSSANTTYQATLAITAGNSSNSTGYIRVGGDADLQLANGLKSIIGGATLEVDGAQARVSLGAGTTNSALTTLSNNAGTFTLRGNTGFGAGGTTINLTTGAFSNSGILYVDAYSYGDGGSTLTANGNFFNTNQMYIGNSGVNSSTTVTLTNFLNSGTLVLAGGNQANATNQSNLSVTGIISGNITGSVRVSGDADFILAAGAKFTAVLSGGSLELDGSQARISVGAGTTNSGLANFANNFGTLVLRGNTGLGAGGVLLTTTGTAFTNFNSFQLDSSYGDGSSTFTVGGSFVNSGTATIGNTGDSGATTMTATAMTNYGTVNLYGSSSFNTTLQINGGEQNYGTLHIYANATLNLGANTFINRAGTVTVDGTLTAGTFSVNGGTVDFTQNLGTGAGPATSTITTGGTLQFDGSVDNSHTITFSGNNAGTLALGAPGTFAGKISGFNSTDTIDLLNTNATSLSYAGNTTAGVLTVTGASGTLATLAFNGNYTTSSFAFASDGHGGTYIT